MVRWSLSSPALRDSVIFGSEESISVVGGNVNSRTSLSSLSCFCIYCVEMGNDRGAVLSHWWTHRVSQQLSPSPRIRKKKKHRLLSLWTQMALRHGIGDWGPRTMDF